MHAKRTKLYDAVRLPYPSAFVLIPHFHLPSTSFYSFTFFKFGIDEGVTTGPVIAHEGEMLVENFDVQM
jgi:hypothetical protein